jgi:hypothetical protein
MGHFPISEGRAASSLSFAQPTSGAADTKGAWSQIIASTPFDISALSARVRLHNVTDDGLLDIGVGGAGSEIVLIPNLLVSGILTPGQLSPFAEEVFIPAYIPQGTRLSARCQTHVGSEQVVCLVQYNGGGLRHCKPWGRVTDYGSVLANSTGTLVTGGNGVAGTWTQLSASTNNIRHLIVMVTTSSQTGNNGILIQLGVGGAGSEVAVWENPDGLYQPAAGVGPLVFNVPILIPPGTRLSTNINSDSGAGFVYQVVAYGFA